ncbi:MAG: hypothetical protein IIX39_05300 [Clostridia bacterium]|nr:hypothetical protein [Clostridia bacterium]
MFKYSCGKLSSNGVSFTIPDNFYINTEPPTTREDFIEFVSIDKSYTISMGIEPSFEGTKYELEQFLSEDGGCLPIGDIESVTINNLHGHQMFFLGCKEEFQLRLSVNCTTEFVVHIAMKNQNKIEEIVKSLTIQSLIKSIGFSD